MFVELLNNKKILVALIFLIALLPRLLVAIKSDKVVAYDALGYDNRAMSIVSGRGYCLEGKPTSHKPPLYSIFLAGIYFIFGHNYLVVRIIQSIIGAFSCVVIYKLANKLSGDSVGIISAVLAICYPAFIKISALLLTECLFTLILLTTSWYIDKLKDKRNFITALILGFWIGISALTRSQMVLYPFFIFLFGIFLFPLDMKKIKYSLLIIIFLSFSLTLLPWIIRNYKVHQAFVPISTQGGEVLYTSYHPRKGYLFGFTANDEVINKSRTLDSKVEENKFLINYTIKNFKDVIGDLPRLELLKLAYFWSPFDWEILPKSPSKGVYNFIYGFFVLFSFLGMILLYREIRNYMALFLPVIFFNLIALIFFGLPRYRLPVDSFLIIFAAVGIVSLFNKFSHKLIPSIITGVFFTFNLLLLVYSDYIRLFAKRVFQSLGIWG